MGFLNFLFVSLKKMFVFQYNSHWISNEVCNFDWLGEMLWLTKAIRFMHESIQWRDFTAWPLNTTKMNTETSTKQWSGSQNPSQMMSGT